MKTDLVRFVFEGEETIDIRIRRPTKEIRLNSKDLTIEAAGIVSKGKTYLPRISFDRLRDVLTLRLSKMISGAAKVHLKFSGKNNDSMIGFYRSSYAVGGEARYLLTTQMEPIGARSVFPCFDEPEKKARFDLRFIVDRKYDAISNMPIKRAKDLAGDKKLVVFYETPRMSCYLLYIGVGNFEFRAKKAGKTLLRLAAVPGRANLANLALGFASKLLKFYQGYFGVDYPLPKLDMIAVPDFAAGAMENWGAMAFREVALLGDEKKSSLQYKQTVAVIVAHEMAHQWFGDLVTMKWWDDLWLNESFASLMECNAPDALFPEWHMRDQQLVGRMSTAMSTDQLRSTRSINAHVRNPAEIEQMFDPGISYSKGSAILYMLEDYVGEGAFRAGLHSYLKSKSYANATKEDLWKAIGAAARKEGILKTEEIAKEWIERPGYPIIEVSEAGDWLRLAQDRFTLSSTIKGSLAWRIPVHYKAQGEPDRRMLMLGKTAKIRIGGAKWIKLNYSQAGFYRVKYPKAMLGRLGAAIRSGRIRNRDAWGIVSDLFVLARSGREPVADYLDFVSEYCPAYDPLLNVSVLGQLQWLHAMTSGRLKERVAKTVSEYGNVLLGKLTWSRRPRDGTLEIILRSACISALGLVGDVAVVNRCAGMFFAYLKSGSRIDSDLRSSVYRVVAFNKAGAYAAFRALYEKEQVPEEKRRLLVALGTVGAANLKSALGFSLSGAVKLQDSFVIPAVESELPGTQGALWKWVKGNWRILMARYPLGTLMLSGFVECFDGMNDVRMYSDFKSFFGKSSNLRDDIKRPLAQTLEKIEANLAFMKKNGL